MPAFPKCGRCRFVVAVVIRPKICTEGFPQLAKRKNAKRASHAPSRSLPNWRSAAIGVTRDGQEQPVAHWHAGLDEQTHERLEREMLFLAESAEQRLRAHPRWGEWDARAQQWLVEAKILFTTRYGNKLLSAFRANPDETFAEPAGAAVRKLLDALYGRTYRVRRATGQMGRATWNAEVLTALGTLADAARNLALEAVNEANLPRDTWHRQTVLSILLLPSAYRHALVLPFWLSREDEHATEEDRQVHTARSVREATERAANKVRRDYVTERGVEIPRRTPGPRPGTQNQQSAARRAIERHIIERNQAGASAEVIAHDAEAQRLYGDARGDRNAALSGQTVRRILRNHKGSDVF